MTTQELLLKAEQTMDFVQSDLRAAGMPDNLRASGLHEPSVFHWAVWPLIVAAGGLYAQIKHLREAVKADGKET